MSTRHALLLSFLAVGCAGEDGDGYVHYETPPITLQPGESGQWVQYVAAPFDQDMDVIEVVGTQSQGGHHAVLYASPTVQEVGFTRPFSQIDQVADKFLGGVGGEAGGTIELPEGVIFRVPAGHALYIQTHYFNAGQEELVGTSSLDVKFAPASDDFLVAKMFTNVNLGFEIPANAQHSASTSCQVERDVNLVMFANHLHEWGDSASTTILAPGATSGQELMLKDDPAWAYEWATNPNFERHDLDEPVRIEAGSTITTNCNWTNTTSESLRFPDEMCLFIGFHIDDGGDVTCVDGDYGEQD